jgi:hypothetical protein
MTWLVNKHHRDCYQASTSLGNRRGTFDPGMYYGLMDARIKSDMYTLGSDLETSRTAYPRILKR